MRLMVQLARAGAGICFGMEETFQADLASGVLVPVLEPFCRLPGFFLYYPSRRNMPPRLRAFVDHLAQHRRTQR